MSVLERVRAELADGAPRLHGAEARVVLPIRQAVVDEVLPLLSGLPPGVSLQFGPAEHVQVRYGGVHVNGRLHRDAVLRPRPVVTLELASQLVAWGLQRLALPPFVRVSGRLVHVSLADLPLPTLLPLWPHVRALSFRSMADGLELTVDVRVDGKARS